MKYFPPLFLIVFSVQFSFAQDQIIMKSAEEIRGKVTEIKIDRIVYKDEGNTEGPSIELRKSDVFMIIYENGKTYTVQENNSSNPIQNSLQPTAVKDNKPDSVIHHIIAFHTNLPEVRKGGGAELIGVGIGFSYEFQNRRKIFGLKFSPTFSLRDFDFDQWSFIFSISPRWYLVNKAPGQFYVGLEGGVGTLFEPSGFNNQNQSYSSIIASGHWVLGSHIFTASGFNSNLELGFGYQYTKTEIVYTSSFGSNSSLSESNMFSFFLRIGIGGRLKGK